MQKESWNLLSIGKRRDHWGGANGFSQGQVENGTKIAEVIQVEKRISEWLGEGSKFVRNEAGDPIFLSKDGLKCVRSDFDCLSSYNSPHAHIEVKMDGEWVKSGQIIL